MKARPLCTVVAERQPDGLTVVKIVDPRTGRSTKVSGPLHPHQVDERVRQVREQLEKAGDRVDHAGG